MIAFWIYIKRCLRINIFLGVLFFMPIISIVFLVFGKSVVGDVKFGVYAEGISGKNISESLCNDNNFKFIEYNNIEKMTADINVSKIDCGYVFDSDFESSLKSLRMDNSIKIISSDFSAGYKFANDIVFSNVMNIISPNIADNFLNEYKISESVKKYYYQILETINVFSFNYINTDGKTDFKENVFKFENFFAFYTMIAAVFGSAICIEYKKRNITKSAFLNVFSFSFLLSVFSLISIFICDELSLFVLLKFIVYVFAVSAFAYLITFCDNVYILCGCLPIIIVCSFVLSIVTFNSGILGVIFGIFNWIFPIGLYYEENIVGMVCYFLIVMLFTNNKYQIFKRKKFQKV